MSIKSICFHTPYLEPTLSEPIEAQCDRRDPHRVDDMGWVSLHSRIQVYTMWPCTRTVVAGGVHTCTHYKCTHYKYTVNWMHTACSQWSHSTLWFSTTRPAHFHWQRLKNWTVSIVTFKVVYVQYMMLMYRMTEGIHGHSGNVRSPIQLYLCPKY